MMRNSQGGHTMATTAKEACSKVCLLIMVNSCGSQMDMCQPGECSAWQWDTGQDDGTERLGHCALAGSAVVPQGGKKKGIRVH
ncbi:MAG TPA: hypothetical protein VHM68_00750 [Candidatus Deferrimicrobium sp.]|nr:hypothetical protein [Candidatus Deferrimicrobium sp.]